MDFVEKVVEMLSLFGVGFVSDVVVLIVKFGIDVVFIMLVCEGVVDDWFWFQGVSVVIGYYVCLVYEGCFDFFVGWEVICGYNVVMLCLFWLFDWLMVEFEWFWVLYVKCNGLLFLCVVYVDVLVSLLLIFSFGVFFDDMSLMFEDIIGLCVLMLGGFLVLGGVFKVGKSDFLIFWFVYMVVGVLFFGFMLFWLLCVFYL